MGNEFQIFAFDLLEIGICRPVGATAVAGRKGFSWEKLSKIFDF